MMEVRQQAEFVCAHWNNDEVINRLELSLPRRLGTEAIEDGIWFYAASDDLEDSDGGSAVNVLLIRKDIHRLHQLLGAWLDGNRTLNDF